MGFRKSKSGIHVYSGGEGSTVVLVPEWPETAEAYSELSPLLAKDHASFVWTRQVWEIPRHLKMDTPAPSAELWNIAFAGHK